MSGLLRKLGRSRLVKLPDGRKQVIDRWEVRSDAADPANLDTLVFLPWGTPHPKYTSCLLVQQPNLDFSGDQRVEQDLVRVYEEMPLADAETTEVQVGRDRVTVDSNGRHVLTREFIQLAAAALIEGAIGSDLSTGGVTYALSGVIHSSDGAVRTIARSYVEADDSWAQVGPVLVDTELNGLSRYKTLFVAKAGTALPALVVGTTTGPFGAKLAAYSTQGSDDAVSRLQLTHLTAGILATSTDYSNNGKLEVRSVTAFGLTPETPAGFVLTATQESEVEGFPTKVYRFAKGEGEISRDPQSSNNGKLLTVAIRRLSAPDATLVAGDFAAGAGFVLVSGPSHQEADGHRVWAASFAKGEGEVGRSTSGRDDGTVVTIRALSAPDGTSFPVAAPDGFVLIDGPDRQEADGHRVWAASFAKGNDVLDTEMNGLRRRTVTAYYTPGALPAGSLVIGTTTHPTDAALILAKLHEVPNDLTVKRVLEYLQPGILAQSDDYPNNGKLHIRSITAFGLVPATPAGFVLTGTQESEVEGLPTKVYRFAQGEGEVGRDPSGRDDGTAVAIRYLSTPGVATSPISAPAGFFLIEGPTRQEADGHIIWRATFAKGNDVLVVDEDGTRRRLVTAFNLAAMPEPGAAHPTDAAFVLRSARQVPNDLSTRYVLEYIEAGATLLQLGDATLGVKFEAGIQTNGSSDRVITRKYAIRPDLAPAQLVRLTPPAITDPVFPAAVIVDQDIQPGRSAAIVVRVFAEVPTPYSDWDDMVIQLPGIQPTALQVLDEFPFRSAPVSESVAVRIDRSFYLGNPQRIPRIAEFRPVDAEGNRTDVLTDTTSPSAEEYLAYVASGTYLCDRCSIHRWQGDIWERRVTYFRAQ